MGGDPVGTIRVRETGRKGCGTFEALQIHQEPADIPSWSFELSGR